MLKTYEISLDIEKELYSPSNLLFSVSNNDLETIELTFVILQDNVSLNLLGSTVDLAIKKPSGLTVYQNCEIVDAFEGTAKVMISNQSYIEYGIHTAEVYVKNIDQLAVTCPFWFMSRMAIMNDETIISENEWSALQVALFNYDLKPIITEGFPTTTPEYIGQMAFDSLNKIAYIANDLTSVSWQTIGTGEGGGGGNDTILGIVPPAITPARIGQIFIDTIGKAAYIATGATLGDWEQIDAAGLASVSWDDITEKPTVFPADTTEATLVALFDAKAAADHDHTSADITDFGTEVGGLITTALTNYVPTIPTEYLTETEGNTNYAPKDHDHISADITDFGTEVGGLITTALTNYVPTIPTEYLTETEGNTNYAPKDHDHTSADITDFGTEVGGLITTALTNYVPTIPTEYLTETEGNNTYAILDHNHDTSYYKKTETYSALEVNDIVDGITTGGGTTVTDNLLSTSAVAALSANQGRVLKAEIDAKPDFADLNNITGAVTVDAEAAVVASSFKNVNGEIAMTIHPTVNAFQSWDELNAAKDFAIEGFEGAPLPLINLNSTIVNATGKLQEAGVDIATTYAAADHDHTSADITDFGTEVGGLITTALTNYVPTIPTEYLTETEGNTNYAPKDHDHISADITDFGTEVGGLITTALTNYVPTIPTEYLTETEGNTNYAPKDHDHTSADITDFGTEVGGLITTALTNYVPTIPTEYLTETEGNTNYAPKIHDHAGVYYPANGGNINGSVTITNKGDLAQQLRFNTDRPWTFKQKGADANAELMLTPDANTKIFRIRSPLGTDALEVKVDDTGANAYINSPVIKQNGIILGEIYAPKDHDHTSADITDFGTEVGGLITTALTNYVPTIPTEYLTETEGNTNYAPKDHDHISADITDFGTEVGGLITTALTNYVPTIPTEYLTETEGNTNYAPKDHDHISADITDFGTEVGGLITTALTNYVPTIPTEYLTETEGNAAYQPKTTTVAAPPITTPAFVGQTVIDTTNDFPYIAVGTTTPDWKRIATTGYADAADNIILGKLGGLSFWSGTQAAYDLLTPNATTVYFITG